MHFKNTMIAMTMLAAAHVGHANDDGSETEVPNDDRGEGEVTIVGDVPEATEVEILQIARAGTGCPAQQDGDVELQGSGALTINFDRMTAEKGDGIPNRDFRKTCQYTVELDYPEGWTYAVEAVVGRAHARLNEEAKGNVKFTTYFQGQSDDILLQEPVDGPSRGPVLVYKEVEEDALVYAPCEARRALNFKGEVLVTGFDGPFAEGIEGRVSLSGPVHVFLRWKPCDAASLDEDVTRTY